MGRHPYGLQGREQWQLQQKALLHCRSGQVQLGFDAVVVQTCTTGVELQTV